LAQWLAVRLSSLEEEATVLTNNAGVRSRDGGTERKD
jgi:hypothetical protein